MPLLSPSDAAVQPAQMDALRNLFQQYIEAQRALKPALRQLHLSPHEPLPPALQEAVLEKVLNFAAQLHPQAPPQLAPAASDGDKGYPLRHRPPSGSSYTDSMTSSTAQAERQKATQRDTPRQRVVQRKCEDVGWDAILPFLADPPVGAHATLRAVGPGSRRRLEQHAWSWMVEEVRAVVCPFIVENGAEMHVRDSYARLDGRERQYVGSVPVARRTPVPVPRHETTPEERRLLDGTVLLDCERQSLLLDRAWREGWLHRRSTSHLLFLSPAFAQPNSLRFLRLNPSRVHVDGVCCDVLRPRRHQPHNAHGTDSNVAVGVAGSPGLGDVHASTVSRAGLTPPVPPLLDGRPAAEFRVTRKLLGDAVSAISRERARSAEVATRPQLSLRLTSLSTTAAARAAQELANSPASTSSLDAPHVMQLGTLHNGDSCSSSGGRGEVVSTQQETPNLFCTPSPHHPCFRHEALPVVVEDVNGATHVFCTRATSMESDMMRGLMRGWLQHHHRLRRQPLYSTAADFLLVGAATQRKSGALAEADDVDYVVCTAIPSAAEAAALHGDATAPSSLRGAHAAEATQHTETAVTIGGDEGKRVMKDTAACPVLLRDVEQLGCVASPASGLQENAHRTAAAARLFHVRLQEWRAKREDVVRRMDTVDPSWLMVGDCRGPLPRPLALHVTEQHLPWLARQLCPDSEGGGLADLQELHLCVAELLLPPGWVSAWQWCLSILRSRRNLLVVSIVADASPSPMAPAAATGEDCMKNVDDSTVVPALECLSDTAAGPIRAQFMEALLDISSLQVLDLHGVTAEAVMQLLQARTSAEAAGGEANQQSFGEVSCVRLARLRDLYVTVRRGHDAGAGPRSTHSGEVFLSAAVFPSLQVFWLDAPRLRRFTFGTSLVLRELHLVSDSVLLCSALRGVEALPFLEVLHVERAVIDDCAFLGDCLALRELLLHACRLSPTLLAASVGGAASGDSGQAEELRGVERAPSLETLSLCYTDEVRQLRNFARCRSLRRVLLTRCNGVSTSSIAGFECLPRLELLALEYTRVSALSHFSKAPALQVLRVDGCKRVLRSSVMGLEMTPHLRELSLQDTNVSTVANFGGGCTALRSLDLSGCRHLDVDGLQGIQALPQLEVLSLSHTPITDVDFLADCMRLTTLYVEGCTGLLPAALEELRSSPVLRRIMANGCTSLTRVGQLGRCRLLEALSVAGAVALTTAGTQGIEHSPHLRFLDLSGTAVHSLRFLARGCRGLRYLSVRGCPLIRSLRELHGVEELPRLRTFNMENLRVTGSLDFLTVSTSLQHVSFSGCAGLTEEDVRALQRSDISTSIP
ncbi:hypothetical protein ABB37_07586 [Leptomonas pyrrhocoris]|uniref:Uncharacterized protein n=1 Tax=Leptomonas pyrrhocoris TaxID=157538 RepID=A0A0N0DT15_LEPPY|nr:hypothetical protein ABB37_07586 [Leptomonas pyrrhocoris]KPA76761.1 hypothetical protein ABB37_07586 [Leptomonas pyrrhocoris]|eukprot:XP_015655200.1 hypothetical protein ABB37_07586 [Leptomonas pyrrhocoris]